MSLASKDFSTTAKAWSVALLSTMFMAANANAVEMGPDGCLPPAELMAQLKAEGQGSIIIADRVVQATPNSPATGVFAFSTAPKSGKAGKGYSFEGDQPSGTPSTKFCLAGTYNNAFALDVSVAKIPAGVASNSNLAKAINFAIKEKGFNPIFYGEKNGSITVVVGDPMKKGQLNGMILLGNNDPKRQAGDQGGLTGLGYSPSYTQSLALAGGIQTAMNNTTALKP